MGNFESRLSKLEARPILKLNETRRRFCSNDVFADMARYTTWLEYRQRNGRWPPDMSRDGYREFEADLLLIMGPS
jgi:hypothetical protein